MTPEPNWNYSKWTPWSQPAVPFHLVLTLTPSFAPLRARIGQPLFTSLIIFKNGQGTWVFREREAAALGQRMIDYLSVPAHRSAYEDALALSQASLVEHLGAVKISSGSTKGSLDQLKALADVFFRFYELAAFVEPVQTAAQQTLNEYLDSNIVRLEELLGVSKDEILSAAYTLATETYALRILASLQQVAAEVLAAQRTDPTLGDLLAGGPGSVATALQRLEDHHESAYRGIADHASRFAWSRNNYARASAVTPESVLLELIDLGGAVAASEELASQLETARSGSELHRDIKHRLVATLPPYEANLMALHDLVGGRLVDERKELVLRTVSAVEILLSSIAEDTQAELEDLRLLTLQEMDRYCENPEAYRGRLNLRREALLVYQADIGVLDELATDDAEFTPMDGPYLAEGHQQVDAVLQRLSDRLDLLEAEPGSANVIKGTTVYREPGQDLIVGNVRIVKDPVRDKLEPGEILVASSTTPDFMAAIGAAVLVITDWGGRTSHAAITARELRKPCIIGTNYGSSALRTGDRIEVNLADGTIKKV